MRVNRRAAHWCALLILSLALGWAMHRAEFPAAFLVGPMIAGMGFGVADTRLKLPRRAFIAAQAVIGLLVARALSASILVSLTRDWMVMLLVVASSVLAGAVVGWVLTRLRILPGATAAWGSSPGAASAMIAMAADHGADVRLVAFMQYLRMVVVVLTASLVSRLLLGAHGGGAPVAAAVPDGLGQLLPLAETLALGAAASFVGLRLRIPAGGVLMPMIAGAVAQSAGLIAITLPPWFLMAAYLLLGWYIGLGFDRAILVYALRALPKLLLASLLLIGLCGLVAWALTGLRGVDPLTAYLATSPGGLDSVAVIAIGSHANIPFVLAVQTLRLFVVILTGPPIARLIGRIA